MNRYWAELRIKSATTGWLTITLNGKVVAGGFVQAREDGPDALEQEGHRVADRWAETKDGIIDRFVMERPK